MYEGTLDKSKDRHMYTTNVVKKNLSTLIACPEETPYVVSIDYRHDDGCTDWDCDSIRLKCKSKKNISTPPKVYAKPMMLEPKKFSAQHKNVQHEGDQGCDSAC